MSYTVRQKNFVMPDQADLDHLKSIADNPASELGDLQKQVADIARIVGYVATHVRGLHETLDDLFKNVQFEKRQV